jgi:sphingomyelin phosphodiesterase
MQAWCYYTWYECNAPPVVQINESEWFSPKPAGEESPPPSGEVIKVLHLTDWHLDPCYDIGAEADCSQYLCCRPYSTNTKLDTAFANASVPASRWGYLYCDTPADLGISMFAEMPKFINLSDVTFAIFTGEIVSPDNDDQLSQAYVEYEEKVTYETFKAWLGTIVSPPFRLS